MNILWYNKLQHRLSKVEKHKLLEIYKRKVIYPHNKLHNARGYYIWAIQALEFLIAQENNNKPVNAG